MPATKGTCEHCQTRLTRAPSFVVWLRCTIGASSREDAERSLLDTAASVASAACAYERAPGVCYPAQTAGIMRIMWEAQAGFCERTVQEDDSVIVHLPSGDVRVDVDGALSPVSQAPPAQPVAGERSFTLWLRCELSSSSQQAVEQALLDAFATTPASVRIETERGRAY